MFFKSKDPSYNASQSPIAFQHVRNIGVGSHAVVDEVRGTFGPFRGRLYARKTIAVRTQEYASEVFREVKLIQGLQHGHIVSVVHTMQQDGGVERRDRYRCSFILEPLADMDLSDFLDVLETSLRGRVTKTIGADLDKLRMWFGCLAGALAYIHDRLIRHRDIKPSNILIKGSRVVISDFGCSKGFEQEITTKSRGPPGEWTPMYAAPEVAAQQDRGRSADIYSLGCVFAEMSTVLLGESRERFVSLRGRPGEREYYRAPTRALRWMLHLKHTARNSPGDDPPLLQCSMLNPNPNLRPHATELAQCFATIHHAYVAHDKRQVDEVKARCDCLAATATSSIARPSGPSFLDQAMSHALDPAYTVSWDLLTPWYKTRLGPMYAKMSAQ